MWSSYLELLILFVQKTQFEEKSTSQETKKSQKGHFRFAANWFVHSNCSLITVRSWSSSETFSMKNQFDESSGAEIRQVCSSTCGIVGLNCPIASQNLSFLLLKNRCSSCCKLLKWVFISWNADTWPTKINLKKTLQVRKKLQEKSDSFNGLLIYFLKLCTCLVLDLDNHLTFFIQKICLMGTWKIG